MRVAHITATFPPYLAGTGNVCYHNARELARRGHTVHVFTAQPVASADWTDPEGVVVHRLAAPVRFGNAPFTPSLIRQLGDFDLVHLHWPYIFGAELTWLACRRANVPYVLTYHIDLVGTGLRSMVFSTYQAFWIGRLLQDARAVFAVAADHFSSTKAAPVAVRLGTPVYEVSNGVDVEKFCPGDRRLARVRLGLSPDEPTLLFVAALDRAHYYKGLGLLLEALPVLRRPLRAVVVGDGDLRSSYEAEAARKGVRDRVQFVGAVRHDTLPDYYRAADVTVLPSTNTESFGLVLAESMACGTPVIASNLPGLRSVVTHGENGLLVKTGDVGDLVKKIQALLDDPVQRQRMGARGRSKVEQRYSWDRIGARLESVYDEIRGQGSPSFETVGNNGVSSLGRRSGKDDQPDDAGSARGTSPLAPS